MWGFTGQEKNPQAYTWAQKHKLHTNTRNSYFQGVYSSYWIRLALEFQTQQKPNNLLAMPITVQLAHDMHLCLEIKRFQLFLCPQIIKYAAPYCFEHL